MKKLAVLFGLMLSLFFVTGCSNDDGGSWGSSPVGGLLMVNGYTGTNAVWHAVDGRLVQSPYAGLPYKHYSYVNVFTGNRDLAILANRSEPLVENVLLKVKDQQFYTSFIGGSSKNAVIHFITEDQPISLTGQDDEAKSGIRFFNLTGEDLAVTVKLDDQVVFADRNSETATSGKENEKFKAQLSNTYTLSIVDKEGKELVNRDRVILEKGRYYSFILTGSAATQTPYYVGVVKQF